MEERGREAAVLTSLSIMGIGGVLATVTGDLLSFLVIALGFVAFLVAAS